MNINYANIKKYSGDLLTHGVGFDVKKPTFLNLSVSNRCNAKCEMCDIWKHPSDDFTIEELQNYLENVYLTDIRNFGITGGEPFLRQDLPLIVEKAVKYLPLLTVIGITTNGFNTERIKRTLPKMLALKPKKVALRITVSLDGIGETHNLTRGVPDVFQKVIKTIDYLKTTFQNVENCVVDLACTITTANSDYDKLNELNEYASKRELPIIYRLAVDVDRIFNKELIKSFGAHSLNFRSEDVQKFLEERVVEQKYGLRAAYYKMMLDYVNNPKAIRSISCKEKRDGVMIDSNGDIYVCSVSGKKIGNLAKNNADELIGNARISRKEVRNNTCAGCFHDHMSHVPLKMILPILYNKISTQ